jgi:FixJ family two-component response regulator
MGTGTDRRVPPPQITVYVVDPDEAVRDSVQALLRTCDGGSIEVVGFPSAEAFLAGLDRTVPAVLIAEVHLPGMSGPELREHLEACGVGLPTILMTCELDGTSKLRARWVEALDFVEKPFVGRILLDRTCQALHTARQQS